MNILDQDQNPGQEKKIISIIEKKEIQKRRNLKKTIQQLIWKKIS
jgi:hypothetical protein